METQTESLKYGVYLRTTSSDFNSIAEQKAKCKKLIGANQNIKYYFDNGCSGENFERFGFQELIKDIKNGTINCVVTSDTTRITRSIDDFIELMKWFAEQNIQLMTAQQNSSLKDVILPFGKVMQ